MSPVQAVAVEVVPASARLLRLSGGWQVGVAANNASALSFQRAVARELPGAEERPGAPGRWNGTVLCFTVGT